MKDTIKQLTNLHIREILTKIEHDGDMTPRLRGRIMNAMHYLAAEIEVEEKLLLLPNQEEVTK